jgi:phage terminase large subunit
LRKRLSLAAIEELEEQIQAVTGERHSTVFGIVKPTHNEEGQVTGGELARCIEFIDGQWAQVEKEPMVYLPEKLERVLTSNKRFIIVFGGRGSGKSVGVVDIALHRIADFGHKVYGLREYQESIDDSVHSLFKAEIERLGFDGFTVQNSTIFHKSGGRTKYRGLSVNPASIKSAASFDLFLSEESAKLSEESLRNLTPTARNEAKPGLPGELTLLEDKDKLENVQMIFIANLDSMADPFTQKFIAPFWNEILRDGYYEDDLHLIVRMNYNDNPWFMQSGLDGERINDKKTLSTAKYQHIWEGYTLDDIDNSIISVDWFNAAIDAHVKLGFSPTGAEVVCLDPSDEGKDAKGITVRRGSVILDCQAVYDVDAFMGCKIACDIARERKADHFVWDGDGMGATLRDHITRYLAGVKIQLSMFRGSSEVSNPDMIYNWSNRGAGTRNNKSNKETFYNRRAQFHWRMRDRFYNTYRAVVLGEYINPDDMISISSSVKDIDVLRSEVCRIPLKGNNNGKIQIMSKMEMRDKLKISSPNMSDSIVMSLDIPDIIVQTNAYRPQPLRRLPR